MEGTGLFLTEPLSFFPCSQLLFKSFSGRKCTFVRNLSCLNFVLVAFRSMMMLMRSRGDTELSPEFQLGLKAEFLPVCIRRNESVPDFFTFSKSIIPARRAKFEVCSEGKQVPGV